MPKCQICGGAGKADLVHANYGYDESLGRCRGEWKQNVPCTDCKGTGQWSEERLAAYERGQAARKSRLERGHSLLEEAKRLGIRPSELSAREHGRA